MADIDMVIALVLSIEDSLKKYDEAKIKQKINPPLCGYNGFYKEDSKESIKRRILVAREELLRLSKALEE